MKKIKKRKVMLGILLLGILLSFGNVTVFGSGQEMTVHFLDVGQGLSVLVQSQGENLLYDGGPRSASSYVVSYLQEQQVEQLDYIVSSHYDEDHVSGLIGCLNSFSVKQVIGADYVHDSSLYESFMEGVAAQGLEVQHPAVGTQFSLGSGFVTILSPENASDDSNANSIAIKVTNGDSSFIFTGDADHNSESNMVSSGIDLDCDVLCVGHHGSATATSWEFLQAAVPEWAVVSCGAGNMYGHPDGDTMEKLQDMEISVYRTDKQGTFFAVSDGTNISWSTEPCNDYSAGDENDIAEAAEGAEGTYEGELETAEETAEETVGFTAETEEMVWISATGSKYHSIPNCGKMNPDKAHQEPISQAETEGYEACKKCF